MIICFNIASIKAIYYTQVYQGQPWDDSSAYIGHDTLFYINGAVMYFPMSYKVFHSLDSSVNISTSIVWVWLIEVLEDVVLGHQVLAAAGVAGDVPPPGHAHGSVGGGPGLTIIVDQLWPIEPGLVSWTVVLIIYWLILYLSLLDLTTLNILPLSMKELMWEVITMLSSSIFFLSSGRVWSRSLEAAWPRAKDQY